MICPALIAQRHPINHQQECVICGNIYTTEVDWAGREALVPFESKGQIKYASALPAQTSTSHSQIGQISSPVRPGVDCDEFT